MTAGFSLSKRVGLIVVVAFLAVLLTLMTMIYLRGGLGPASKLPSPARLEALASLVEDASPADRARALEAVRTPQFDAAVRPGAALGATDPAQTPVEAEILASYRAALVGREVEIAPRSAERRYVRAFENALNAVEFRISLATGETLVVATQNPFIVAPFGLPVGFGAALVGLFIALATLVMLHREFRPLSRLAAAVDAVDPTAHRAAEATALPPIHARSPELKALIGAFERFQERLSLLIRARMALVGGIQHDVRTFATRLRLRVDKIDDPAERARAVEDIGHMITLLDDALLASRAGVNELDEELIEITPLVASEVADRHASGADVELLSGDTPAAVLGDRLALRRVVANLVDNALKYGGKARLSVEATSGEVRINVDDDGPGVPADRRAFLLEPFTRLDGSRARGTGGAGLGLSIVSSLVDGHGGRVEIGEAPMGGARIAVTLPVFKPAS